MLFHCSLQISVLMAVMMTGYKMTYLAHFHLVEDVIGFGSVNQMVLLNSHVGLDTIGMMMTKHVKMNLLPVIQVYLHSFSSSLHLH